jgi:DNA-binding MarR family transcriptional regulator
MLEGRGSSRILLSPTEVRILKLIKTKSQTEKKIAKKIELDPLLLSPVITDLILKGYLEIFRRRRLYFFSREFCVITSEGISALNRAQSPFEGLLEMVKSRALQAIDDITAESPVLKAAVISARTIYRVAKAVA